MDVPYKYRSLITGKNGARLSVVFLLFVQFVGVPSVTLADEISLEERQHFQAQQLREASKARAQSQLGYDDIYRDPKNRQIDYYALTQQINILSNIVRSLAETQETNNPPTARLTTLPRALSVISSHGRSQDGSQGRPLDKSQVGNVYGPSGPTEKAVRLLLEYQLMVNGNPRLKVGDIIEESSFISADVVTVDGSLVERYKIDKSTGTWISQ